MRVLSFQKRFNNHGLRKIELQNLEEIEIKSKDSWEKRHPKKGYDRPKGIRWPSGRAWPSARVSLLKWVFLRSLQMQRLPCTPEVLMEGTSYWLYGVRNCGDEEVLGRESSFLRTALRQAWSPRLTPSSCTLRGGGPYLHSSWSCCKECWRSYESHRCHSLVLGRHTTCVLELGWCHCRGLRSQRRALSPCRGHCKTGFLRCLGRCDRDPGCARSRGSWCACAQECHRKTGSRQCHLQGENQSIKQAASWCRNPPTNQRSMGCCPR